MEQFTNPTPLDRRLELFASKDSAPKLGRGSLLAPVFGAVALVALTIAPVLKPTLVTGAPVESASVIQATVDPIVTAAIQ
jgi:hypothetical protein